MKQYLYPFSAMVDQQSLKTALLLNAVDPSIGGVLIRGHKGTGKSTAARALAQLLPDIRVVKDSPFNSSAGRYIRAERITPQERNFRIAVDATLRQAALRQAREGGKRKGSLSVKVDDFRKSGQQRHWRS